MKYMRLVALLAVICLGWSVAPVAGQQPETVLFDDAPWSFTLGGGYLKVEGDQVVENGGFLALRLGYTRSVRWTYELGLDYAPSLSDRDLGPNRRNIDGSAWLARVGPDALFHLRNTENMRFDPYLSAGIGLYMSNKQFVSDKIEPYVSLGAGLFYHINDAWALRGDARTAMIGRKTDFNLWGMVGVTYRWGAQIDPEYRLAGGDLDSDADGLPDWLELVLGTDPLNPDTDGDGLLDGEEYWMFFTDPLNPDTDYDGLTDGAEANVYGTDPLNPDTDGGGVYDGHEVMEDGTDPLDPRDDLQLFRLNIEFDYDKSDLRPQYFDELDVVARVLQRDPGATARIEGHADRRPRSDRTYNIRLSERRAQAVLNYLADIGGISRDRMSAHGYGFDRPIAPNDTEENMQRNRRTEIYIRPSGDDVPLDTRDAFVPPPAEEPSPIK